MIDLFSPVLDEGAAIVFVEGDAQFFPRIHYDGAVPRDGLPQRLSGHEEESHRFFLRRDDDLIAVTEENQ